MKLACLCFISLFLTSCTPNIMGSFGHFTQFSEHPDSMRKFFEVHEVVIEEKRNNAEAK